MAGALVDKNFRALSLFRIVFALYLLGDFCSYYGCCFTDFYGAAGVLPSAAFYADQGVAARSLGHQFVALLDWANVLFVLPFVYPAAIVCFGIGVWTRLSNLIVLILNSYLYARNPYVMSGADSLSRLMLIWCLFLPLGRHWSIDSLNDASLKDRDYAAFPFLAIKTQVCSVYLLGGMTKLSGGPWREGQAIIWVLSDNVWAGGAFGRYLVEHLPGLLVCATYSIMFFQVSFPLLIASPWRNDLAKGVALLGAAAMHLSFIAFLNIGDFPFISLAVLIVLMPDAWLRSAWDAVRTRLAPGIQSPLPVLSTSLTGMRGAADATAAGTLARSSWLRSLKGVSGGGAVASSASILSSTAWYHPAAWVCGLLALLALSSNVHSIVRIKAKETQADPPGFLRELNRFASYLQVGQSWYLFAPIPTHFLWDIRIIAYNADGSAGGPAKGTEAPLLRKQAEIGTIEFASYRWQKFFSNTDNFAASGWAALGEFLCRKADAANPESAIGVVEFIVSRTPVEPAMPRESTTTQRTFECQR